MERGWVKSSVSETPGDGKRGGKGPEVGASLGHLGGESREGMEVMSEVKGSFPVRKEAVGSQFCIRYLPPAPQGPLSLVCHSQVPPWGGLSGLAEHPATQRGQNDPWNVNKTREELTCQAPRHPLWQNPLGAPLYRQGN